MSQKLEIVTKICPKCGESKPSNQYYPSKYRKDGLEFLCKICESKRHHDAIRIQKNCLECGMGFTTSKQRSLIVCDPCKYLWDQYNKKISRMCIVCNTRRDSNYYYSHLNNVCKYCFSEKAKRPKTSSICLHCGVTYSCFPKQAGKNWMCCSDCKYMWRKYNHNISATIYQRKNRLQRNEKHKERKKAMPSSYANCVYCDKRFYKMLNTKNCGNIVCKAKTMCNYENTNTYLFITKIRFRACTVCGMAVFSCNAKVSHKKCRTELKKRQKSNWDNANREHVKKYMVEIQPIHRLNYMKKMLGRLMDVLDMSESELNKQKSNWSRSVRKDKPCVVCGQKAVHAHHLLYSSKYPRLSLNLNNGVPLCRGHHAEVHLLDPYVALIRKGDRSLIWRGSNTV